MIKEKYHPLKAKEKWVCRHGATRRILIGLAHWPSTTLHMLSSPLGLSLKPKHPTLPPHSFCERKRIKRPSFGPEPPHTEPHLRSEPQSRSSVRWKFRTISITLSVWAQRETLLSFSLYLSLSLSSFSLSSPLSNPNAVAPPHSRGDHSRASMERPQCHCEFTRFLSLPQNPSLSLSRNRNFFLGLKKIANLWLILSVYCVGRDFRSSRSGFCVWRGEIWMLIVSSNCAAFPILCVLGINSRFWSDFRFWGRA